MEMGEEGMKLEDSSQESVLSFHPEFQNGSGHQPCGYKGEFLKRNWWLRKTSKIEKFNMLPMAY